MEKSTMARRANGEGSIYLRKDGRWTAAISVYGRRYAVYGKTRREVAEKLVQFQRGSQAGQLVEPAKLTVSEYLTTWLEVTKPTLRPTSWASYEELARVHVVPALGGLRLQALRPLHLVRLYAAL